VRVPQLLKELDLANRREVDPFLVLAEADLLDGDDLRI